ncbi:TPA: multiprotein-bridging factor 1 family protein [Streptococcus suis]
MIKKKRLDKHVPKRESDNYEDWSVKDIRLKLGMTQKELAEKLGGVTSSAVSEWERGTYHPSDENANKLQKLYKELGIEGMYDSIDCRDKILAIQGRYNLSLSKFAQLVGVGYDTAKGWMNGRTPKLKHLSVINRMYYDIQNKVTDVPQQIRSANFCQIDQFDKTSWKAKIKNPIISWR